jgi:hypothetical protein
MDASTFALPASTATVATITSFQSVMTDGSATSAPAGAAGSAANPALRARTTAKSRDARRRVRGNVERSKRMLIPPW